MPNNIRGITVKIGGDTTGLEKALKGVNSTIRSTQSQLREVERQLKFDPKNTELLNQKQKLLNKAVDETREKLGTLKEAEKQVQEQFERGEVSQEQYDALKREIIKTESQLKNLERQAAESNATLAKMGVIAGEISTKADKVSTATRGISTAAGAAIVGIAGMGYAAATSADDLNTLAKQTGLSTETLQKAKYATDLIDVSYETFTGSINKMVGKLRTNEEGFNDLGIATRDASDNMLSTEDIFFNAVEVLSQIENETERDVAAQELFGKSAAELAGIIDDGGKSLKEYGDQASELGLILDQDTLNSLNEVNDTIDQLKADALGTFAKSGAQALEALTPVLDDVSKAISGVLEWIGSLDSEQIKFGLSALAVVAAISPVTKVVSKVSGAFSKLMPVLSKTGVFLKGLKPVLAGVGGALKGVFSIIAANPIILIIAAIAAAVTALVVLIVKNWDKIKAWLAAVVAKIQEVVANIKQKVTDAKNNVVGKFQEIKQNVLDKVETMKTKIREKFQTIKDNLISPIREAKEKVKGFIADIQSFFDNMKAKLPHINLPHFKVSYSVPKTKVGKFAWEDVLGLEGKPNISVDWYSKAMNNAMLLNSPTIFGAANGRLLGGGEAGQEVVAGSHTLMNMIRGAVSEGGSSALLAEMQALNRNITNLGIYLDGDTLVGKLAPGIDNALGQSRDSYGRRALA